MTSTAANVIQQGILRRAQGPRPARIAPSFLRLGVLDITAPRVIENHRHNEYRLKRKDTRWR